jgi:essential nuclear protein 1
MGKETVYFKETREKAITKKDKQDDFRQKQSKFAPREKSKNISKRDAEVVRKNKFH